MAQESEGNVNMNGHHDEGMVDVNLQVVVADDKRGHAEPASEKDSTTVGAIEISKPNGTVKDGEIEFDVKKCGFRTRIRTYFSSVKNDNIVSKLARTVGWRYIIITFILYGLDQGAIHSLNELGRVYFYKDRGLTPAETQRSIAWSDMSWNVKPFFGLVMDTLPVFGFHYRPWLVMFGVIGTAGYATISAAVSNQDLLSNAASITMLCLGMNAIVWNDVAVDGLCCAKMKEYPEVDSECVSLQEICLISVSIVFTLLSGLIIQTIGLQWLYIFIAIISCGATIAAQFIPDVQEKAMARVCIPGPRNFYNQLKHVLSIFRDRNYVKMFLYSGISAFAIDLNSVMVYWYDDVAKFSKTFQGAIATVGFVFALALVLIYVSFLKGWRYRTLLFSCQLCQALISSLDLILVCLAKDAFWGHFLALSDRVGVRAMGKLKGIIIMTVICDVIPDTGESTGIAILWAIGNFMGGDFLSPMVGSWILDGLNIKQGSYGNLPWAILIRTLVRLLPLPFIPLLIQSGSSLDKTRYDLDELKSDGTNEKGENTSDNDNDNDKGSDTTSLNGTLALKETSDSEEKSSTGTSDTVDNKSLEI